jgi:hypothetical protein
VKARRDTTRDGGVGMDRSLNLIEHSRLYAAIGFAATVRRSLI